MALDSYSGLKTSIADFLLRTDLTTVIPDFITLAEAQINRDVRHWRMVTSTTLSLDARFVDLPTDWVDTIRITTGVTGYGPLKLLSVADMSQMRGDNNDTSGVPQFYSHIGSELDLFPSPDSTYTGGFIYSAKIPALSDTNASNWLLEQAPDAYLYGALIQSAPYLVEDARIAVWGGLYGAAVKRLNETSDAAKWSGTGLTFGTRRTS